MSHLPPHDSMDPTTDTETGAPTETGIDPVTPTDPVTEESAQRRVRIGTLVWGLIALLVALWSLSTMLLDWSLDPVLMGIGLAGLVGITLIAGGLAGAARRSD